MKPNLVIVGLGNPGDQYERTRHNMGFRALDLLAEAEESSWRTLQKFDSLGMESRVLTVPTLLLKPTTFMNLSGNAVRKVVDYYGLDPSNQVLVLCDDVDVPLGEIRFRKTGGPGTHNGLRSLCDIYGEQFARMRIGLGSPTKGEDLATWVLSIPPPEEEKILMEAVEKIPDMLRSFVLDGK
jgi:peptidyl-tRNA hydrolase, PTH1 family